MLCAVLACGINREDQSHSSTLALIETPSLSQHSFSVAQHRGLPGADYSLVVYLVCGVPAGLLLPDWIWPVLYLIGLLLTLIWLKPIQWSRRVQLDVAAGTIHIQGSPINLSTHRVSLEWNSDRKNSTLRVTAVRSTLRRTSLKLDRLVLSQEQHHRLEKLLVNAQRRTGSPADVPTALRSLQTPEKTS